MNNPLSWATAIGLSICMICFMRMLAVVYQNGKLDLVAVRVIRKSSLLPLTIMVAALALVCGGLAYSAQTIPFIPWAMLVIVLGGAIWSVGRGINAVRKLRAS